MERAETAGLACHLEPRVAPTKREPLRSRQQRKQARVAERTEEQRTAVSVVYFYISVYCGSGNFRAVHIFTVFEIKVIFSALSGCNDFTTVRPVTFPCASMY